jgi:SagB-type dehydrogenase family enzyme
MMHKNIGIEFLKGSTYKHMPQTDQSLGKPQPPLEMPHHGKPIDLIKFSDIQIPDMSLKEAVTARTSIRSYPQKTLSLNELSYALHMTQGIRKVRDGIATLRTVPSAGARHAFETYLVINNVEGLEKGLYRYLALSHQLVLVKSSESIALDVSQAALKQKMIEEASITFIWVADAYRMTYRYGMRGYRYMFLDAGHVCQNLYLIAQQLHCGTCAIAAYDDDAMNQLLDFDGVNTFVIYMATLGKLD